MESIIQFIVDIVLFIAFLGCAAALFAPERDLGHEAKLVATVAGVFVLILLIGSLSAIIVPAGNVAVVTSFGKIQDDTLPPGLHFRLPFINQTHNINTRVQAHAFDEIEAASSEYQTVKLTGVMNYHLDGTQAADLYQKVGDDFASKVLDPAFKDYIKQVVPQYHVTEILAKRDEIRSRAKADLQANLNQYHIVVDDIYIANIAFSDQYQAAIEAKQTAQQQVEVEKQILAQKQIQAQQAVAAAQGQADANVVTAQGQAKANNEITQSLTPALIQWQAIQKLAGDIKVMLLPNNNNLILNTDSLLPAASATP